MTYMNALRGLRPSWRIRLRTTLDEPLAMLRLAVPIMLIALVNMGMGRLMWPRTRLPCG